MDEFNEHQITRILAWYDCWKDEGFNRSDNKDAPIVAKLREKLPDPDKYISKYSFNW